VKCPFCANIDDKVIDSREGRVGDTSLGLGVLPFGSAECSFGTYCTKLHFCCRTAIYTHR